MLLLLACATTAEAPEPGYSDGPYDCCAQGDGTECCADAEPGMCFEYGGIYGDCVPDGSEIEGKVLCGFCCSGDAREPMVETAETFDGYPAGCGPGEAPPSILVCVTCGDGACGEGENPCVCPEDCGG
jgi:hypothetical protein